ncbi:MAG: hypothetical protein ACPLPT_10600 [Moorellales bacterium]
MEARGLLAADPTSAAPVGITVKSRIERGDPYSIPRVYQVEITVLEVLRGEPAAAVLREQGLAPPGGAREPLLARVRVGFFSRRGGVVEQEELNLDKERFSVWSGDGKEPYSVPEAQPQPTLVGRVLKPAEQAEGWLLAEVPKQETRPLLVFHREQTEGIYGVFGKLWLALF